MSASTTGYSSPVIVRNTNQKASGFVFAFSLVFVLLATAVLVSFLTTDARTEWMIPLAGLLALLGAFFSLCAIILKAIHRRRLLESFESTTCLSVRGRTVTGGHFIASSPDDTDSLWLSIAARDETKMTLCGVFGQRQISVSGFEFRPHVIEGSLSEQNLSFKKQIAVAFRKNDMELLTSPDIRMTSQNVVVQEQYGERALHVWLVTYSNSQLRISCIPSSVNAL